MIWLRRLGWLTVAIITVVVVVEGFIFRLPEPKDAMVIDHGVLFIGDDDKGVAVRLPLRDTFGVGSADHARLVAGFEVPAGLQHDLFLLMPATHRAVILALNGKPLYDSRSYAPWIGPAIASPLLVRLPLSMLTVGQNELSATIEAGDYIVSVYLAQIFIGSEAALAPSYKLHLWIEERLKTMALGIQVLLGLGIIFAYFQRRKDPLFSWLGGFMLATFMPTAVSFVGFRPEFHNILPYIIVLTPTFGLFSIGVAYCVANVPPPKAPAVLALAVPTLCILLMLAGLMPTRTVPAFVAVVVTVASVIVATAVTAWGALWRGSLEARVMLSPYVLLAGFILSDLCTGTGILERPSVSVTPFARPIFLLAIFAVLMRRLAQSLDRLDSANEDLSRRLAEREAELALLHRAEQAEAAQLVREQERLRLTHDLHDGISGHLVSIIAMTEGVGGDTDPVEQAARRALDDLRLVIYSLDLGDGDLPLALANFRERITPQLQRIGVELDWSTAGLPEVSGVTPSNALSILRILQEALTNALKHGPARKITVRGERSPEGKAAITIENDGTAFAETGRGFGLANMRRRASELHGEIRLTPLDRGTRLMLLLPLRLPDVGDALPNGSRSNLPEPSAQLARN